MELLYIWIDNYKKIKQQGFNFSTKWKFKHQDGRLIIRPSQYNLPKDFFNKSKTINTRYSNNDNETDQIEKGQTHYPIFNVTAIVGENGSGKSALLDFIKYELSMYEPWVQKGHSNNVEWLSTLKDNFVIFKHGDHTFLAKSIDKKTQFLKLNIDDNSVSKNLEIDSLSLSKFQWKTDNKSRGLPSTTVFYSNFFDGKNEFERKGLVNISTNFLLKKDKERYEIEKGWGRKFDHEWMEVDNVEAHKMKEIERQIDLLIEINSYSDKKEIKERLTFLPEELYITISKLDKSKIPTLLENQFLKNKEKTNKLKKIIESFEDKFKTANKKVKTDLDLFRIEFKETLFYRELRRTFRGTSDTVKFLLEFFSSVEKEDWQIQVDKFVERVSKDYTSRDNIYSKLQDLLEKQSIKVYSSYIDDQQNFSSQKAVVIVKIDSLKKRFGELYNIFRQYKDIIGFGSHFLDFSWRNMSTGELSLFNLYARFFSVLNSYHQPPYYPQFWKDSILFLLDEAETGFHPKWQREYLDVLLEFLTKKNIISNRSEDNPAMGVQIILTTHSPFILSDLPKEHIIFLEKDENGNCKVVDGLNEKKQTFGANIHSLLTDSFFMDSLSGVFSDKKINDVISFLNNENSSSKLNSKEVKSIIELIGEPILQKHLQLLLKDIHHNEAMDDKAKIKRLEQRIIELENKEKNDKN